MSFFQTKEYQDFKRVHTRVQQEGGNTLKNMNIYIDRFAAAIEKATSEYDDIGFYMDNTTPCYKWAPSPELSKPVDYNKEKKEPEPIQVSLF